MFEKSTRPRRSPSGGIRTSATSEFTIFPNAAPMMTPIAMSRTFPFMANSLNSLNMVISFLDRELEPDGEDAVRILLHHCGRGVVIQLKARRRREKIGKTDGQLR